MLLLVYVLVGSWLVDEDPLALFLRASDAVVVLGVVLLLGARVTLLFVMPGVWLYVLASQLRARIFQARREASADCSKNGT